MVGLATGLLLVTGCGDKKLDKPLPTAPQHLVVKGPWRNGASLPARYTCDGSSVKPDVRARLPVGANGLAIVMTDPDAPGGTFVHWTRWGASEGQNSFGKTGYGAPCPPKGDKPHRYVVTLYALRKPLGLKAGSKPDDVVAAIRPLAIASGSLTGSYRR